MGPKPVIFLAVPIVVVVYRSEDQQVRHIQRSDLAQSSPTESTPPAPVTRPRPTRPAAATYIPTEDEIDSLAKIGR